MTYPQHIRAVLSLGLPLIGGHLAQLAIGLTDTIMLGWYGAEALAALTLASALFFLLFLMGSGFAWAVMPMVAQYHAAGDAVSIRRATRMGLWLSTLFFLCVLPLLWFSGDILLALGQSPDIADGAARYLRIAGLGMLPALLVMVFKSYLAALEHTRVVLLVTLAAALANGLGNYALIFGNWGAPELGITGAAMSSIVSQLVGLIGIAFYVHRALPEHALFRRLWNPDWEMFAQVFRLGLPIGLTTLAEVGLFEATAIMMGWLGTVPLAAHGIALQTAAATFMIHVGFANVATIRAGNAFGRKDVAHLIRGAYTVFALSLAVASVTITLFLTLPGHIVSLYIDPADPARDAILALGVQLLAVAAVFQLVDGSQVVTLGLLRGVQDTRVPMWMALFAYWCVGIPASYVFGFVAGFGAVGVWSGLVAGLGVAALLMILRFRRRIMLDMAPAH
ncbi:MATE family efflux transporter [Puniceibacterium sp. IMCC21224]|uniref:MATE family efflux transporter n=1 Tax=Puniceibacterium sp. IMCC21224 TaxID=1618204 RepID=UPI00065D8946|nr:MATE family efflux transporter [Puniceibacterium sp. IMCC21224]KMK67990.1 putative efflux protein, MATE family [Puniceibacterium sp. IMCC21224]